MRTGKHWKDRQHVRSAEGGCLADGGEDMLTIKGNMRRRKKGRPNGL